VKGPRADVEVPVRLLEDEAARDTDWGVQLLRAAEPTRVMAGRKQRVLLALGRPASHRVPFLLRPAILVAVLGCAAIASAAFGHWTAWIEKAYRHVAPAQDQALAPKRAQQGPARVALLPRASGASDASSRPPSSIAGAGVGSVGSADMELDLGAGGGQDPREKHGASTGLARPKRALVARAGEDTSAVSQAMRALRVEGDPVGARSLAIRYLGEHPGGALAEEALAIAIEAATVHHDPDAGDLGARYIRLYPSGPFRDRAMKARALSSRGSSP